VTKETYGWDGRRPWLFLLASDPFQDPTWAMLTKTGPQAYHNACLGGPSWSAPSALLFSRPLYLLRNEQHWAEGHVHHKLQLVSHTERGELWQPCSPQLLANEDIGSERIYLS
jgi:hypothetical protein